MTTLENKLLSIIQDIDLGVITETKKLSLLDEIGEVLTNRIILSLLNEVSEDKKDVFIEKINENKDDPDKILLFIDHFVDNADEIIDIELDKYKSDLQIALGKN